MSDEDPDVERAEMLTRWESAAAGWARRADQVREMGMPVSTWMIDHLALQPGERVLELAAGPGDTGFLAAELVEPGGTLICSDATEAMLEIARGRARQMGIENVEFKQLELEWIDLETATVDAILCRWGVMLILDPSAAAHEMRRVLRPGGRVALAVWDEARRNPWATIPGRVLVGLGHTAPADPNAPGMFTLAAPGALAELLEGAGFVDVEVDAVDLPGPTRASTSTSTSSSTSRACSRGSFASSPRISRWRSGAESGSCSPISRPKTGRSGSPGGRSSRPQTPE